MSTLRMLIGSNFFLLSILISTAVEAEAAADGEIFITNNGSGTRSFNMGKITGNVYWNANFGLDTSDSLEGGTVTVTQGNNGGWWVDSYQSGGNNTEGIGAGIYKIVSLQNPSEHYFYLNLRTDDLFNRGGIFDIYFDYDDNDGFSCGDGLGLCGDIFTGELINIWTWTDAIHSLGEFELSDPSGLTVVPSGSPSHPLIEWTSSEPPYINPTVGGSKHDIWRKKGSGSYTKLQDNYIPLSYTDTDVLTGSGTTFYYKVRGRDTADTKYSAGYSNVGSVVGSFGGEKIAIGGGNNPQQSELRVFNYPNPFNPETSITFELPAASEIELVVYNILGKEVAKLASGHYAAGKHTVIWDGSRTASGLYFYTLITDDEVAIGKMSLTK